MKIPWHWVWPHEAKPWFIYCKRRIQRASIRTEQLVTLDSMQRWDPREVDCASGRTWSLVSPGVLPARVSTEARQEGFKDKIESEEWQTILAAFDDAPKEYFDAVSANPEIGRDKRETKVYSAISIKLTNEKPRTFCQKYPNFARSLYSVLQWALSHPNTVSSDSWRLCLSEKYIDHSYILIFLSWWPSFRTLWNVASVTAVRETRVQTKGEISLGSCFFFFLQPLKGLCLSLSPSRTKAIKSLEWKGQGASCASMEASKPCSDHPALQRGATPDSDKIRGCHPM